MIKGLYTASSSMVANQRRLNIISNNLANVNSAGFKKDEGISESFPEMLISRIEAGKRTKDLGNLGTGVRLKESFTDYQQGLLQETGNGLDIAIEGNGFFVIETPQGTRYTRDGSFTLNKEGQIVTKQGYLVLGERGPLQTIEGSSIKVDSNGQLYLGGLRGDKFLIRDFPDRRLLEKKGENLYRSDSVGEELTLKDYQLKQGYRESSNVNVVQEMVKMIEVNRLYEANQKVISNLDRTLDKLVNTVGRVG